MGHPETLLCSWNSGECEDCITSGNCETEKVPKIYRKAFSDGLAKGYRDGVLDGSAQAFSLLMGEGVELVAVKAREALRQAGNTE
jgi:hypothetical protein